MFPLSIIIIYLFIYFLSPSIVHTVFGVSSGKRKLGPQKKATIPKNIDRMSIAHLQVESVDAALKGTKKGFASSNKKERGQLNLRRNPI